MPCQICRSLAVCSDVPLNSTSRGWSSLFFDALEIDLCGLRELDNNFDVFTFLTGSSLAIGEVAPKSIRGAALRLFVFLACCLKIEATETDLTFFTAAAPSASGAIWRLCAPRAERLNSMLTTRCVSDRAFLRCSEVRGLQRRDSGWSDASTWKEQHPSRIARNNANPDRTEREKH
jgi:hypothetical protein